MVQKLNMILITSPELADFRRRLKSLETRVRTILVPSFKLLISHSKMAKLSLLHSIDHGVTIQLRSFRYAYSPKLMSMHQISYTYCM